MCLHLVLFQLYNQNLLNLYLKHVKQFVEFCVKRSHTCSTVSLPGNFKKISLISRDKFKFKDIRNGLLKFERVSMILIA